MPGNNKNKKKAIRPEPKPEPITVPLKVKVEPPKPEPMIIPLKPDKIREKTVIKEEAKMVYVTQTTEIIKNLKERKIYPKLEEFENYKTKIKEKNSITKFFKPKIIRKQCDNEGNYLENSIDHESDGSFIKVELPMNFIQEEIKRKPFYLVEVKQFDFTLLGRILPMNLPNTNDVFSLEAIRPNKGAYENSDFDEDFNEVIILYLLYYIDNFNTR